MPHTFVETLRGGSVEDLQAGMLQLVQLAGRSHQIADVKLSHEAHLEDGAMLYTALVIITTC
jgi:hypothetical protein